MVRMADGSIQLQTASSKTTLADSNSYERKDKTRSSANLKSSSSLKNLLKFKTSKSSSSLNRSPTNTSIFHAAEMTMILPKRNLSEQERFKNCRELRLKYNQLLNRLPKKHKKKHEWSNANQDLYTTDHLVRLEIEVKKLEDVFEQMAAKNSNIRKFSFFGFRLAI
ncbi:unnamed protein product [Oikopleura dioica]|nr:unnamed protein product [Oikopleura dioica]